MSTYNGWRNRLTWLVNVWYNPENKSDLEWIKEDLEEKLEAVQGTILADMIDNGIIDWNELEEALESDEEEDEE